MPYLSWVVSANNRGYEGNFLERFQRELDTIYHLAPKYGLNAEIVVVDWNTPKENAPIKDAISWDLATIPTRVVRVTPEIHASLPNPHGLNFFECIAKNVGVRRAGGQFVATINADSIYSPEMIQRLARHNLDPECFYRANRFDINPEGKLARINTWKESYVPDGRSFPEPQIKQYDFGTSPQLHFNASGEFTLMAHSEWMKIGAHPEVPFNCCVDGYMVYLAAKAGLRQVILNEPIYHQEHPRHGDGCLYRGYIPFWSETEPYSPPTVPWFGLPNHDLETTVIHG